MATAQEVALLKKIYKNASAQEQKKKKRKNEIKEKRGLKKSICSRRIVYDDSSWDTSLFSTRGTRS